MEIKWLQDFVALSNVGSFSVAAKERNVTQSAFSRRIRSLEEWVSAELVDRSTHPVSLTEQGSALLEPARRMIGLAYSTREDLGFASKDQEEIVSFALTSDIPAHLFPTWLRQVESSTGQINARINPNFNCHAGAFEMPQADGK